MKISEENRGNFIILDIEGQFNAITYHELEKRLNSLIGKGEKRFLLNLSGLDYISSAGLRVLLVAAKKLTSCNGQIVLASLKDQVRKVFDTAGFSAFFPMFDTREDAMRNFL
ncbi:MAG: STAS domain-containing protein [Planctomycetes bacterium]|nr:STAS domain-containing protein [Planctomycetota bacterium]